MTRPPQPPPAAGQPLAGPVRLYARQRGWELSEQGNELLREASDPATPGERLRAILADLTPRGDVVTEEEGTRLTVVAEAVFLHPSLPFDLLGPALLRADLDTTPWFNPAVPLLLHSDPKPGYAEAALRLLRGFFGAERLVQLEPTATLAEAVALIVGRRVRHESKAQDLARHLAGLFSAPCPSPVDFHDSRGIQHPHYRANSEYLPTTTTAPAFLDVKDETCGPWRQLRVRGEMTIGRGSDAQIQLDGDSVSRHHARLTVGADGWVHVEDLGSTNGTRINEHRIERGVLRPDDWLHIGARILRVTYEGVVERSQPPAEVYDSIDTRNLPGQMDGSYLPRTTNAPASLVLQDDASGRWRWIEVRKPMLIGSGSDAQLRLDGDGVAPHHARLAVGTDGWVRIKDLGSAVGTRVNHRAIVRGVLRPDDTLDIGPHRMSVFYEGQTWCSWGQQVSDRLPRDGLTGALTKGALLHEVRKASRLAQETGTALSLVVFNLDRFKRLNDDHGYQVGDQVLRRVAALVGAIYPDLALGYCGMDTFALVLPAVGREEAAAQGERLRQTVGAWRGESPLGSPLTTTVTVAVTTFQPDDVRLTMPPPLVLTPALEGLGDAKRGGRDRVVSF